MTPTGVNHAESSISHRGGARPGAGRKPRNAGGVRIRPIVRPATAAALEHHRASGALPSIGRVLDEWANLVAQREDELRAALDERRGAKIERDALMQQLRLAIRRADAAEAKLRARRVRAKAREPASAPADSSQATLDLMERAARTKCAAGEHYMDPPGLAAGETLCYACRTSGQHGAHRVVPAG